MLSIAQVGIVTALLQKLDVLGRDESPSERTGKDKDRDKDRRTLDIVAATEAMLAAWELVRSLPLCCSHTEQAVAACAVVPTAALRC